MKSGKRKAQIVKADYGCVNLNTATLAVRAVFVNLFFQKLLIYDFLAGNNYPDSPHS